MRIALKNAAGETVSSASFEPGFIAALRDGIRIEDRHAYMQMSRTMEKLRQRGVGATPEANIITQLGNEMLATTDATDAVTFSVEED